MKNYQAVYLFTMGLAAVGAVALTAGTQAATGAPDSSNRLDSGTLLVGELTKSLNAKKVKAGDIVKAKITQDVVVHGQLVVHRDSKLIGHITEVNAGTKDDRQSSLGIIFDKVILKGGKEIEFDGLIQALAGPAPELSRVDQPDAMSPPPFLGVGQPNSAGQPMGSRRGNSAGPNQASVPRAGDIPSASVVSPPGLEMPAAGPSGKLSAGAHGVIAIQGVGLRTGTPGSAMGSMIVARKDELKLEAGTQLIVQVNPLVNATSQQ